MRWDSRAKTAATDSLDALDPPGLWLAVRRGMLNRCPCCGEGKVFDGYLTLVPQCSGCGAPLARLRADDAPPYFTILLTGHLLVPLVLMVEHRWMPPMWLHMAVWLPLFTLLCMALLRPVKGAVVGWMCQLGFLEAASPQPGDA
jgi:uncharacterized protein (DUF983 family)